MPKVIELSGVVGWEITAKGLKNRFPKDDGDVLLKVDSVGGSVFEANRLYNAILDYPGNISVEFGAIAASAASYFPLAVGSENIKVRENTTFMAHKAWSFAIGNADEMKAEAEILDGFDKIIAKVYSKITGKSIDDTLVDMGNELWLIGGQSVVDAGFASGVIEGDSDNDEGEESEVVAKSEIVARMEEARIRLQEVEAKEDMEKWAAKINTTLNVVDVDDAGQKLLFGESPSGHNDMEGSMDLKAFFEKNPEAKAEHDELIKSAKAEGRAETHDEAVKADRERFAEVLALSGVGIPENVLKSAKEGQTVSDFAVNELKIRNEKIAAKKDKKPEGMDGVDADDQIPVKPEGEEKSAAENKVDAAIDKIVGKKKETK